MANESGANTRPWRTTASILNHELWVPPVGTQLTELLCSTLKSLTILSGIPSLVRSSHNAGRLRESNAARRSTNAAKVGWLKSCPHCAVLRKVAIRSHVERPGVLVAVYYLVREQLPRYCFWLPLFVTILIAMFVTYCLSPCLLLKFAECRCCTARDHWWNFPPMDLACIRAVIYAKARRLVARSRKLGG